MDDDLLLDADSEVTIRQHLLLVSLGREPADLAIEVGRLFASYSRQWLADQEIVIAGRRIAYIGPIGSYRGTVAERCAIRNCRRCRGWARCTSTSNRRI